MCYKFESVHAESLHCYSCPFYITTWHIMIHCHCLTHVSVLFQPGLHSSSKETQLFDSCISFGKDCRSVDMWYSILTLTQGHHEKWIQKSCVSFEEECISVKDITWESTGHCHLFKWFSWKGFGTFLARLKNNSVSITFISFNETWHFIAVICHLSR